MSAFFTFVSNIYRHNYRLYSRTALIIACSLGGYMLKALQLFLFPFILTVAGYGYQGGVGKWEKYRMLLGKPIKILRLFSVSSRLSLYFQNIGCTSENL